MYVNRRNFSIFEEIGVDEHDDDVRLHTLNRNMIVSCMHNEKYAIKPLL